jgi:carnitine O-acetyltransferase
MYTGLISRQIRVSSRHHLVAPSIPHLSAPFSTSTASMFALSKFRGNPADQPKTFSRQRELPRLPIPSLEDTFTRYIASLEPILLQAEEQGKLESRATSASELQKRRTWARDAAKEGTLVQKLQQRLIGELKSRLSAGARTYG